MEEPVFLLKQSFEQFASMVPGSVYVLDVLQKEICYVKADDLFLCGFPVEVVLQLGYDFYAHVIYVEDLPLWTKVYKCILQYLYQREEEQEKIDFFSCTFRLQRSSSFVARPLLQMVYHRMKPVWMDNELRYLICSLEGSTHKEAGNLCLHYKGGMNYSEYNFVTNRWMQKKKKILTERERVILMLAQQGKSAIEMSDILCKGHNTIRNQIKALFAKLGRHTMLGAIELARNFRMIYPKM